MSDYAKLPRLLVRKSLVLCFRCAGVILTMLGVRKKRILLYTDSRGRSLSAFAVFPPYHVYLNVLYKVDKRISPIKGTTYVDFISGFTAEELARYDYVLLHVGVVDFSPRPLEMVRSRYEMGKTKFDSVLGEEALRDYYQCGWGVMYDGQDTLNMYSKDLLQRQVITKLKLCPNLIIISGNQIPQGWVGDYWRDRPSNINVMSEYFGIVEEGMAGCVIKTNWTEALVKKMTTDGIHLSDRGHFDIARKVVAFL